MTRCLALALKVKRHTSFLHSYKEVADIAGISEATARRMMPILVSLGFVNIIINPDGHRTFAFQLIRARKFKSKFDGKMIAPKHSDIVLNDENTDFTNLKTLTTALRALAVRERQSARDYLKQVAHDAQDPDKGTSLSRVKQARKTLRHYGIEKFTDKGMSFRYLLKVLGCGADSLKDVLAYGESRNLFIRYVPEPEYLYVGKGMGSMAWEMIEEEGFQWFTRSGLGRRASARIAVVY